jgi:uncharacterized repeat protein (TIGR02543 family)
MKQKKTMLIALAVVVLSLAFTACKHDPDPERTKTYTVTFESNGGTTVASQALNEGQKITKPVDPTKSGYECKFLGWFDQNLVNVYDFNSSVYADITLYAKWVFYEIGDTGIGGGIIFYINDTGFIMTDNNKTYYYLEAASEDMPTTLRWVTATETPFPSITTVEGLGTGRKNTALILAEDSTAPAAKSCVDYSGINNLTDWFLPSRAEFAELYKIKDVIGISTGLYWSSECAVGPAFAFNFDTGSMSP